MAGVGALIVKIRRRAAGNKQKPRFHNTQAILKIRRRMEELELTQQDLAELTGITQSHISYLLSGHVKAPSVNVALAVARALEASVEAIWDAPPLRGVKR